MGASTRVLIVEDLPTDAELCEREVAKALGACEFRRVETREEYLAALAEFRPALIVSDFKLPHFDGMAALELAKERAPDVPFIILTGSMNEDTAVECMKAGAWDYVIKEHVKRMGAAVQGAMERQHVRMERALAEHALKASEMRYRRLFEAAKDGILILDAETGRIVDVNPFLVELTGYSDEDFLGKHLWEIGPFKDVAASRDSFATLQPEKYVRHDDLPLKARDGREIPVEFVSNVYRVDSQTVIQCNIRDISARRRMEEERNKMLRWQQGISQVQQSLLAPAPLEEKVRNITDSIVRLLDADFCRIWLIRPGDSCERGCVHAEAKEGPHVCRARDRCLHLLASSGRYTHIDGKAHRRVPFGAYKIGRVASGEDHRFLTNDAPNDPLVHNHEWARELGLVSFAGYQLRIPGGETLGVLALFAKHPIPPAEDALLDGLSSALAQAIRQAQTEDSLRHSEERFRVLFEQAADCILLMEITPEGIPVIREANGAAFRLLGYERDEVIGQPVSFMEAAPDAPTVVAGRRRDVLSGTGKVFEARHQCKDGTTRDFECSVSEIRIGSKVFAVSFERDITERKRAKEALRESETRYKVILEGAAEGILVADLESRRFTYANPAMCRMLGYTQEELTRLTVNDIHPKEDLPHVISEFEAQARGEKTLAPAIPCLRQDGDVIYADVVSAMVEMGGRKCNLGFFSDITERKRAEAKREKLEEQLRASQKMEAIGSLAGGIAHDFNNLLSVILSYTGFALDGARQGDPQRDDLLEVKKAAERAAALTGQLLAFGRKQLLRPVLLDLNQVTAGVEQMLRRTLGEDIDFVQVLAPDLGLTLADPGQLEQVLMNLVVNARDAMPEGGKLTIETRNVEIDEEDAARHLAVKPGSYVQLVVTDTGCGMDDQTRAQIFEPFFTTKEKGKGTGLGLSTAYGIVKQSGGNIWVYSEPGRGTTFKIYLPRELSATTTAVINPPTVPRRSTGSETILLVEDEEALCRVARRTLAAAGYTVLAAAAGDEALLTSAQHRGEIHLLLTDVVMPGRSGRQLAQELSRTRPMLKVLYMSGYTDDAIVHHGVLDAGTHFLGKPFTASDLTRKVREVLDEGIPDLADGHAQALETDAGMKEQPLDAGALRALAPDVLGKLRKAVVAVRYDEIVELVETIRATEPDMAAALRRMADRFDYDGLRELLGR